MHCKAQRSTARSTAGSDTHTEDQESPDPNGQDAVYNNANLSALHCERTNRRREVDGEGAAEGRGDKGGRCGSNGGDGAESEEHGRRGREEASMGGRGGDDTPPADCPICYLKLRDPVYPMLKDGQPCDNHRGQPCESGRHWLCKACLVRSCLTLGTSCPTCKQSIVQMMPSDGIPEAVPQRPESDAADMPESDAADIECRFCPEGEGGGCTPNDKLFFCSQESCNRAWHQRCARIPHNAKEVWCEEHAPVRLDALAPFLPHATP